jgi:hypothetical protein
MEQNKDRLQADTMLRIERPAIEQADCNNKQK